jgi:nucleoside-diphosphate-sugar epimerase
VTSSAIVTGGAGFLGSHLVDTLAARRASVVACDDLRTGRLANLERAVSAGRTTFIYADPEVDFATLQEVIRSSGARDIDCVYHFMNAIPENLAILESFIEMCLEHGSRLVLASSFTTEAAFGPSGYTCDEIVNRAEAMVALAVRERSLDARVVRFVNCYGPRLQTVDDSMITALLEAGVAGRPMQAHAFGRQARSMMYVSDALERLEEVLVNPPSREPVTIASDGKHSVAEIADIIASFGSRYEPRFRFRDLLRARAERNATRSSTSLHEGLRQTFAWFSKNGRLFV